MALPIKLVSKARHRVGPSGNCHEDFPVFAWRPALAFFVAFHPEFHPCGPSPIADDQQGISAHSRSPAHHIAMGWTPPHTYGIECQTGSVKSPVTE